MQRSQGAQGTQVQPAEQFPLLLPALAPWPQAVTINQPRPPPTSPPTGASYRRVPFATRSSPSYPECLTAAACSKYQGLVHWCFPSDGHIVGPLQYGLGKNYYSSHRKDQNPGHLPPCPSSVHTVRYLTKPSQRSPRIQLPCFSTGTLSISGRSR